ncbi:MAG: anti-sigma factor family protein [Armatimonadota bacterium]
MKCKNAVTLISQYLEHDLPSDMYDQMTEHLASCTDCRREMEEMQQTLTIISKLPRQEPVFDLWEAFAPKMIDTAASECIEFETAIIPRLLNTLSKGWTIFYIVTGYNTKKKLQFLTGSR